MASGGGRLSDWISVMGLYYFDNTLFDEMLIPEQLDREILISEILSNLAELEVLYPNPELFKHILNNWSKSRIKIWQHLYDTTMYEYNPLDNYNMQSRELEKEKDNENKTDDFTSTRKEHIGEEEKRNISRIEDDSGNTTKTDRELTKGNDATKSVELDNTWVYGFNSTDKALRDSIDKNIDSTDEWNTDKTDNYTDEWKQNESENTDIGGNKNTDLNRNDIDNRKIISTVDKNKENDRNIYGSTGIYSKQNLIEQEREIAVFSIYDFIVTDIKKRFCLQVW